MLVSFNYNLERVFLQYAECERYHDHSASFMIEGSRSVVHVPFTTVVNASEMLAGSAFDSPCNVSLSQRGSFTIAQQTIELDNKKVLKLSKETLAISKRTTRSYQFEKSIVHVEFL